LETNKTQDVISKSHFNIVVMSLSKASTKQPFSPVRLTLTLNPSPHNLELEEICSIIYSRVHELFAERLISYQIEDYDF